MEFGAPLLGVFATRDPIILKDYVQAVEELGYDFIATDEVLLSDDPNTIYHESLTLFSYLAAITTQIKFVSGVIILPKRSTIIAAKQAAEVDVLSNGRLRLGVGVGWNEKEFRALGVDFHTRGKLIEEQIELMQLLWTQSRVTYHGKFHNLDDIGLNLLPVQRPIPIWIGGGAEVVLRRAARMADGWIVDHELTGDPLKQTVTRLHSYLEEYGRQPSGFSIIAYLRTDRIAETKWKHVIPEWDMLGVTHTIVLPPWGENMKSLDDFLAALNQFKSRMA